MREILFRGKRVDNGEWATSPYPYGTMSSDTMTHDFVLNTVCEYTGITDKKGNKIFEGDIFHIEKENYYGIVCYGRYCNPFNDDPNRKHVGFYVEWENRPELLRKDLAFWSYECNVVGNIFDNSELIGGNIFENY